MIFVLIHSPLVGPLTWEPVAERLRAGGHDVFRPMLQDYADGGPYWRQQAASVMRSVNGSLGHLRGLAFAEQQAEAVARGLDRAGQPLVLVGHSGAGALLPAIRQALKHPVGGYIFVDAGIHRDGLSRLEMMALEGPEFAAELRTHLAAGGRFPEWQDQQLRPILPDAGPRYRLLQQLRPRSLDFFNEPIPVFAGWPDAPCGYMQFSAAYDVPAAQASAGGWPPRSFEAASAGHFHMLVDPAAVAVALIELAVSMQAGSG